MKQDRFELENLLMRCWSITDDLEDVIQVVGDTEMDARSQDKILNMLIGMREVYDNRFNNTLNLFGTLVHNRTIDDRNRIDYDGLV